MTTMEPESLDLLAFLRAHIAGDEQAVMSLLDLLGAERVAAMVTGAAVQLGTELYGSVEEFDRRLAERQRNELRR